MVEETLQGMQVRGEDEVALWGRVLEHEESAFAALFDTHRGAVFNQALRLLAQPADAEEVAAAAFFELWRKRDRVSLVNGSVLPWLLVTAANLSRNTLRAHLRRQQVLRSLPAEHGDVENRNFERIDADLPRSDLVKALKNLSMRDVALITLTTLDGFSVAEVAPMLGLSENAARVRLHRAYKRLRLALGSYVSASSTTQEVQE